MSYRTLLDVQDFFLAFLALHIAFWSGPLSCVATVFPPAPLACILGRSTFLGEVQGKRERARERRRETQKERSISRMVHHVCSCDTFQIFLCSGQRRWPTVPFPSFPLSSEEKKQSKKKKKNLSTGNIPTRKHWINGFEVVWGALFLTWLQPSHPL